MRKRVVLYLLLGIGIGFHFTAGAQAEASQTAYGLFDKLIDLGILDPPPLSGKIKFPGRVEMVRDGENCEYTIYSNGIGFKDLQDHGMFLYSERTGSWSLTARIELPDQEDMDFDAQAGLMIRSHGTQKNSLYFFNTLLFANPQFVSNVRHDWYRMHEGQRRIALSHHRVVSPLFLRVTRIAPKNICFSEWSCDGQQWEFGSWIELNMPDQVSYGIAFGPGKRSEKEFYCKASNVSFTPAPTTAFRQTASYYQAGKPIPVTLEIIRSQNPTEKITITESPPQNWNILTINNGGIKKGDQIVWTVPSSTACVSYTIMPATDSDGLATFSGQINNLQIMGTESLDKILTEIKKPMEPNWRTWKTSDGLSHPDPSFLTVSPTGNVLVHYRLHPEIDRLDGYTLRSLSRPSENSPKQMRSFEDEYGQLWTLHIKNKQVVCLFKKNIEDIWNRFTIAPIKSGAENHFWTRTWSKYLDQVFHNRCLLYVTGDSLYTFDPESGITTQIKHVDETPFEEFEQIFSAKDGIWIYGSGQIAKIFFLNGEIIPESPWKEYLSKEGIPHISFITNIIEYEDRQGQKLFVSAIIKERAVLFHYDGESWQTYYHFDDYGESVVCEDDSIWYWNASKSSLILVEEDGKGRTLERSYFPNITNHIAKDPHSGFWVSTRDGLMKQTPRLWQVPASIRGMEKAVYSIHEDNRGNLWFAGQDSILTLQDEKWKIYSLPEKLVNYSPSPCPYHSVASLPNGHIFFSGYGYTQTFYTIYNLNLISFDPKTERMKIFSREQAIHGMSPLDNGNLLLRDFDNCIGEFDGIDFHPLLQIDEQLVYNNPEIIYKAKNGDLWVGLKDELLSYQGENCRTFNPDSGYEGGQAWCITEIDKEKIWVGTQDSVFEYDGNAWNKMKTFNATVFSIHQSQDQSVWVATQDGLYRFWQQNWFKISEKQGLPSSTVFDIFEDSQNRIWAATNKGLSLYHPHNDPHPPQTWIQEKGKQDVISPDGTILIGCSGIDKWKNTPEEELQYSYRIDGNTWSPFSHDVLISETGLQTGKHQIEVRAIDWNWNIDPTPAMWDFTVPPFWYKQPLFLGSMVIALLIICILVGLHIKHDINLEKLVDQRTDLLQQSNKALLESQNRLLLTEERERRQLASDLHDSISQSLALSIMDLSMIGDAEENEAISQQITPIHERLEQTLQSTQSLTFELCPQSLYRMGLESAIDELAERSSELFGIEITFEDDHTPKPLSEEMRYFLFRAIRELVMNIKKYANATSAMITLQREQDRIKIQVSDDGIGFDPASLEVNSKQRGGYGLYHIKEQLKRFGGTFEIESKPNLGTIVTIQAPLQIDSNHSTKDST